MYGIEIRRRVLLAAATGLPVTAAAGETDEVRSASRKVWLPRAGAAVVLLCVMLGVRRRVRASP